MNGKHKKLATSLLLQVFWNDEASMVENAILPGCSSWTALTYSNLADVQKFITLRPFIGSGGVNNRGNLRNCSTIVMFMLQPDSGCKNTKTTKLC
jgi:hypothetical protein